MPLSSRKNSPTLKMYAFLTLKALGQLALFVEKLSKHDTSTPNPSKLASFFHVVFQPQSSRGLRSDEGIASVLPGGHGRRLGVESELLNLVATSDSAGCAII